MIPPPTPPAPPAYIDVSLVGDEPCDWNDDDMWESHIHGGYRCGKCGETSDCIYCDRSQKNVNCARNRAEISNWEVERNYKDASRDYDAQVRYWRKIVDAAEEEN